jgi:hypothetical protein
MDYFQAIESELQEARNLQARFPERLKKAVLSAVLWRTSIFIFFFTKLDRRGL